LADQFLVSSASLPAPIGIASIAVAISTLHGDLVVLDAVLDESAEQLLSAFLPDDLLPACRKNNGILGVGFR
jgi:hypothetical protein